MVAPDPRDQTIAELRESLRWTVQMLEVARTHNLYRTPLFEEVLAVARQRAEG